MKLHLPPCLRACILTCMAAVNVCTTVSTGSILIGSAVLTIAMSPSAHAEWAPADIAYTGTATIDAASTETLTLTENTALTYTYAGTAGPIAAAGFDIKLVANNTADGASVQMNFQSSPITANSVWFSQGRFQINSNDVVANAGTLYAQGGQLYVNANISNAITIGSSTYAENTATVSGAALRIEQGKTLSGSITLVEDAAITVNQGAATLTGAIATAGNKLEKKGNGALVFNGGNTHHFDALTLNGGVLRSTASGNNVAVAADSLDIAATSTLAHTSWNSVWTIGDLTSSLDDSSNVTLTLDQQGTHFFRQRYLFNGTAAVEENRLFDGIIDVKHTGANNNGTWQIEMHAGTATQLSRTVVNLNNCAILAVTDAQVELEGLTSTNGNAYVFSGANTSNAQTNNDNNTATPLYETDGIVRTLTLSGNDDYSYQGTIAGNLIIEKTGTGLQTFGNLGDNITINLHAGSLMLKGTIGANTQIHTEAGTSVTVPWKLTNEDDIYTATYARPDYVTGEGTVETGMIAAVGDTSYASNDAKYTKLAVGDYAGESATIVSGLVTLITGNTDNPGDLADFGNIQTFVLDGGGFILPTSADREFVFDKNIVLQGDGFLRSWGEGATTSTLRLTGAISGNGKLTKTDGGTMTLAGDMSAFTGGIVIGKGGLIFDTDTTLTSLEMYNNASLGVTGGHRVTLVSSTDAPWEPKEGTFSFNLEDGGDFSTYRIQFSNATTLNLTSETHGSLTVNGLQCADMGNTDIRVGARTALNVTGDSTGGNFTKNNTFLLTHWKAKAAIVVEGTLNMLNHGQFAAVNPNQGSPTIDVMDGGIMNLKGLDIVWRDGVNANGLIITLAQGSAMHLGSGGISTAGGLTLTLNGGTIGILNSTTAWTTAKDLTLSGDVVVDTRLYTAATDGTAGTYSTAGGTITLSGAVTGEGKLIKAGNGTLNLANVNKLDVQGGFVGMNGQLTISELTAMTAGGGRFLVDLGTDSVVANTYSGPVNLTLNATTAGSHIVFTGDAALQKENVDFDIFLDRGLTFDAATGLIVSNGQVSVTIGGEAATEHYNLVWAGDAGEVWSNTTVQAWTGADDQRFSTGDSVTFDGSGIKDINIEGIVTPGAITVTGEADYAFTGGVITGEGALTKSGTGILTLQTDLSDWSGAVNLDGGTIAFAGALGAGTINVSGTSGLSWLKGNVTDLSSRLKIANGSEVTFSIAEGDTVIFNTVLSPLQDGDTATFTKKGLGTLQITKNNALYGDIIVAEGTLAVNGGSDPYGCITGSVTIKSGAKMLVERGNFTGWYPGAKITSLLLEEDAEIILGQNSNTVTHSMGGQALTMNGATIRSTVENNSIEFTSQAVVTIGGTKLSTIEANLILDNGNSTDGTVFNVADAVAGDGVDFIVKGGVSTHRGNKSLTKRGDGTMEITGNYAADKIKIEKGGLILHGATLNNDALWVETGSTLQFAANSSSTWTLTGDITLNSGTFLFEKDASLLLNSTDKRHHTFAAGTTLKGEGTIVVGIPTHEDQTDGYRNLTLAGSTANFTGYVDVQASAGAENAYRAALYLNSSDGAFGGVVRTQGVRFGVPGIIDDSAVPEMARIIVNRSMSVGGFDGVGGSLSTEAAGNARITLTVGRNDDHAFGGSIGSRIDLVKAGTGKQTFNGDLSAFDGTISIEGGTLDIGSTGYAKSLSLTGANASLATTGKVSIGAGQTLTVTATGTVVNADLDLGGGTLNLGDMSAESHAVGLGNHNLTLSATDKTALSLKLSGDLSAGDTIDLFTGVAGIWDDDASLTLGADTLLSTYFNTADIAALSNAKLQFAGGKLQIVLARGTNALLYGQKDNGIWKADSPFDADDNPFTADTNAEFGTIADGDSMTVQLGGEIAAGSVTIAAGEGKTYHFVQQQGATPAGAITVMNGMTITSGTADFAAGTLQPTADATITVNGGTLSLQTGATNDQVSITLGDGATLLWGTGNTEDYAAGNRLSIADGAHVTLDVNGNRIVLGQGTGSGVTGATGSVTLADTATGGSLVLGGSNALHGTLDLGGQTLRLDAGDNYDLNITGNGDLVVRGNVSLTGNNSFAGTLHIGDNGDSEGQSGSAANPVNATLSLTGTSLGNVSAIELIAGADGTGSTMNYSAAANATIAAPITGTGDVNFSGGHEITLSGANTYAGKTGIGAGTTLKVTDKTLSAGTDIGNAGGAGGTLHLTNTKADGAYDFANKIGEGVSVTLSGGTVNWLSDAGHEKTYTGTTTIAAGTTVTAAGPLTTGENSKIVLEGADSVLSLDFSTAGFPTWTNGHTASGAGTLELNGTGQILSSESLGSLIDTAAGAPTLGKLVLTGGTLDVTSESHKAQLKQIQTLEIEAGAQLRVRSRGMQDQAGLTLSLAGAGTGAAGTETAAALYFGNGENIGAVSRNVSLAADAAVYVAADKTGTLSGSYTGNGHVMTKTGDGSLVFTNAAGLDTGSFTVNAGTLQFQAGASGTFGTVALSAGTTLSFYNGANSDNKLTVSNLSLAGDATLQTTFHSGSILVGNLTGTNSTLTIDGASDATQTQFVVVQGGTFSGIIDVKQSNARADRGLVFGAAGTDALANATVKLSQLAATAGSRLLAFAVGGDADGTIQIAGLEGIADATVISTANFDRTQTSAATLADGNARTLEIVGSGAGVFSGSIGSNLTVRMDGTGTQTLAGALADGTRYEAAQGTLALSGADQTGSHTFTAKGGTLDMNGYARAADATGKDTLVYSSGSIDNLHLGAGMEVTVTEGFTGSIQLGGSTVLDGGSLHFELSGADPEKQDLSTFYTVGATGTLALGGSGEKTMLFFNPEENTLDPSAEKTGKDYVLIANVGDAFDNIANLESVLGYNMSTEGRTSYTFKIDTLDNGQKNLVLTVTGSAATLTWQGSSGDIWNTSAENLVWTDGTGPQSFMDDDKVHFGTMDSAQTIQIADDGVRMGGMTVTGETDYTFNGGAITSSSARGGLTVGTVDGTGTTVELFTGTLTINTANTYKGATTINSGTVIAGNASALSNKALLMNGGALNLNFEGALATSGVTMNGGELAALQNASVSNLAIAGADQEKTLAASGGKTLTLTAGNATIEGALTIGSAEKTGTVKFDIGTRSLATAQDIAVGGGTLQFDGTTGSFTGAHVALDGGDLRLTGGLTATLSGLSGNGRAVVDGSTLAFSASVDTDTQIDASNAVIDAADTLSLGNLHLVSGTATLTGTVVINGLTEGADTTLTIGKNGGGAGNATLGAGVTSVGHVVIANGSLTVKNGDSLTFLESHGNVTTAATGDSSLAIGAAWLKDGSSIDSKIAVTFTGSDALAGEKAISWLGDTEAGEKTTLGNVTVDKKQGTVEVGVQPSDVNLTGKAELSSLLIKRGSVGIYSNIATVTNGITLAGTEATLNMRNLNPQAGITLQQGSLSNAGSYTGTVTIDDVSTTGTSFAMGGLTDQATVVLAQFGQGSQLTGLGSLKLGNSTIQLSQAMDPVFKMNDATTGTVGIADGATVTFAVGSILGDVLKNGSGSYSVTDGSLSGLVDGNAFKNGVVFDDALTLHNIKAEVQGGNLVFTQLIPDDDTTYISSEEGHDINSYDAMDGFTKVVVDVDTAIDLTGATPSPEQAADGLIIKNLAGGADLSVLGGEDDKITLNNNVSSTGFDGNISIDTAGLQIRNTDALGDGADPSQRELTIRGTLTSTGLVTITNGKLTLDGNGNSLDGGLTIIDQDGDKGQLTLNGSTALGGLIQGGGGNTADILVGQGATVSLRHGTTLQAWMSGSTAVLAVADDATVTFGNGAHVDGMSLNLGKNASATIETTAGDLLLNGLNGTGALVGETGAQLGLNLAGGSTAVFNGDLSDYEGQIAVSGEGSQVIAASAENASFDIRGGKLTFRNDSADASSVRSYGATTLQGGSLHFDTRAVDNNGALVNRGIKLASLTTQAPVLRNATSNTLVFDMNLTNDLQDNALVTVANNSGQLAQGTVIEVNIHGIAANFTFTPGEDMSFTLLDGLDGMLTDAERDLSFNSAQSALNKYFSQTSLEFTNENHTLVMTGTAITADEMRYHQNAATTETGRAGGALLDYLFVSSNPQGTAPGSLAANVLTAMEGLIANGNADRAMAAIAGSTVTSLSSSFAAGFDARLTSIRNRMTGMGVDQTLVNEDMPYFHAWISADGGNTTLDADGTLAGYKLNSWGGTVGVDVDVNDYLTLGAAFTASYGDLTADGAETASGDLDTYTAALFAHAQVKRWSHDLVLAVSTADASLDRTVDYGAGSYTAKGSTNGLGFGALYELAYNIPVSEDDGSVFSPLFRASFTHVSIDGYTETGAESMGLAVGKQDVSYATFGLGARYVAAVGENVFNRTATLELRAMVLQDAGNRRGEADVALNGSTGRTRTVKGAEPGSTGIQVGASLNVPIEESSAIFADVNFDARSKTTTVNGSVGYRINF